MKSLYLLTIAMLFASSLFAQEKSIPLYPNGVPNSKPTPATYIEQTGKDWLSHVSIPTITPYLPEKGKATGTAIIIFPGGGYAGEAFDHEGIAVAKEFNKIGVTAFVVKYRLPSDSIMVDKTIGPLQDAQRSVQIVRQQAAQWGVNPAKIGIIGFSAGGHLASTLLTHYSKAVIANADNISLRPDFVLLLYPVVTFGPYAHEGTKDNLLGKNPPQDQLDLYSNEKQVTADTPPTFLVHAGDDNVVPVQNSLMLYDALLQNKVKTEMHIFQAGGHGFGLINSKSKDRWFDWAANWLNENGF